MECIDLTVRIEEPGGSRSERAMDFETLRKDLEAALNSAARTLTTETDDVVAFHSDAIVHRAWNRSRSIVTLHFQCKHATERWPVYETIIVDMIQGLTRGSVARHRVAWDDLLPAPRDKTLIRSWVAFGGGRSPLPNLHFTLLSPMGRLERLLDGAEYKNFLDGYRRMWRRSADSGGSPSGSSPESLLGAGPSDALVLLRQAAERGDERTFEENVAKLDWSQASPELYREVVRIALAAGAHGTARHLSEQGSAEFPDDPELARMASVLAPPVTVRRSPPIGDRAAEMAWVRANRSLYPGQWAAIRGGELLGVAASLIELKKAVGSFDDVLVTRLS